MKVSNIFLSMVAAGSLLTSCSLDTPTYDFKNDDNAVSSITDVKALMNGSYYALGQYEFLGNYAVSLGDFVSGMSTGSSASGHMYSFSNFTFDETNSELADLWGYGYLVAANATAAVSKTKTLIAEGGIGESDLPTAYSYVGQCYALKAISFYYMVNYFGLPYSSANASTPGIIIYDMDVPAVSDKVSRATVGETYDRIVADLDSATYYLEQAGSAAPTNAYYLGTMGLEALKANVYLSLGQYAKAAEAAKNALAAKNGSAEAAIASTLSASDYEAIWGVTTETAEDLFTIKKSSDDNLSANALNTLYGSYYCSIQNSATSKLAATDLRANLLYTGDGGGTTSSKYDGKADQATSNIPIYRKSEMALIIAECEARLGNLDEAKQYLFYTASRNTAIASTADLPSTQSELLSFINDERVREFYQEGKRFFNARRTGEVISGDNFTNWDISKFVFPIPSNEVNSGMGVEQNSGWSANLPR